MCGIYGSTIAYSENQVREKLKRTSFRGPDKMGVRLFDDEKHPIRLGHNRLSIIDLDVRSDQPLSYQEKIHIVFNGEIFNFKSIKKELAHKGYEFKTTSDTEVICAAYLEYGQDCVNHFNGMFAFVIYDKVKKLLFGARDRLGQKPFYYTHNQKHFEFASQLSSIQPFNKNLTISKEAISAYLLWGTIPDPYSIFNEIKKLEAGHSFTFDIETGNFKTKQYWDLDYEGKNRFKGNYQDAQNELEKLLSDAVKIRMFADVPVGIFLSGGIDSSLVSALAAKETPGKVKTFSVKFDNKEFDESNYAKKVASHLQTEHNVIECDYKEGIALIENLSYFYDEPFDDASAIPSMLLSKYTREHVTVALSGDAGDENFLGYHRYNWMRYIEKAYKLPDPLRSTIARALTMTPHYKAKTIGNVINKATINDAYLATKRDLNSKWFDLSGYDYKDEFNSYLFHNNKNIYERISDFDIKTYLNWDINTKVDRASMAFSLEVRSPMLDYRIVDFSRALPTAFKFIKGNQKRILKDVLYKHVPKELFDRPKSGFTMPFKNWFRNELKDYVLSELNDDGLATIPFIDKKEVKVMIDQHMNGSWNRYAIIWRLLVLKQWLKNNGKGYSIK
ncbi:asparagine synthase (glutamine-hydrolyzing) [uncultured Kriegella sp.]|uniref:asparagine synthase (glutamine-hydrolyzing) n=1 Tax=uncultured Kriegella sp. TaxID=1798910 RepID=UPI0030DA6E18|tara:strand:+ start:152193 stop:154043 length:1851 start_codon:yes stop_codon:yes gene_type:complete